MVGGILLVLGMLLAVPVAVMLGGAIWSAAFGWTASATDESAEGAAA
jgi:hypothetical protein